MELLIFGITNILCFVIGAKVGQKVTKGEDIKLPNVNPMEAIRAHQNKVEARIEQDRMDTIMRNIEAYDGTGRGQEDIPGRKG